MSNFTPAFAFLMESECDDRNWSGKRVADVGGGFSDRKDDYGAGTVYGLSKVIRLREGFTPEDFGIPDFSDASLRLTTVDVAAVLWRRIWDRYGCARIDRQDVATKFFDTMGNITVIAETVKILQRACRTLGATIDVDGVIGEHTLAAANGSDPQMLLSSMCVRQLEFYEAIVRAHPDQQGNLDHLWRFRAARVPT